MSHFRTGLIAKISIKYVLPTCILADFAVFRVFWGISRYFAEIPEALFHFGVYDYGEVKSFFRIKGLQKRAFWGQKVYYYYFFVSLFPWV